MSSFVSQPQWAVLRYDEEYFAPVHWSAVSTLAASSPSFAEHAIDDLVGRSQTLTARRRQSRAATGGADLKWAPPSTNRVHFVVSPEAPCAKLTMLLDPAVATEPLGSQATIFLRAAVDAEGGITGAKLLYTTTGQAQTRRMVDLLKRSARIESTGAAGPAEAFIVLFTHNGTDLGWIVSGAQALL